MSNPADEPLLARRLSGLDGVRAVAVMLVVLFHVEVPGFAHGFLGVDLFFVLSGFLITTTLVEEAGATGGVRLGEFWARRVRRLLPAALLVLAVVMAWAWLGARPYQRPHLGGDLAASLLYYANWHFIDQGLYFAVEPQVSPLHHMWSLSLEEQFYVLWPLAFWGAWRLGSALVGGRRGRRVALGLAVTVCSLLLLASQARMWWWTLHPQRADRPYMGTDAKALEPLAGALVALVVASGPVRRLLARLAPVLGWLAAAGVAMLVVATKNDVKYYRGGALVLSAATALLVACLVLAPRGGLARLLGWGPFAALGRVSYGVYLWHWPLAVWLGAHHGFHPARAAATVVLSVACAALSHRFVERPVLRRRVPGLRHARGTLLAALAAVLVMVLATVPLGGTPLSRAVRSVLPRPAISPATLMVVGDSAPYHLRPQLDAAAAARGLTLVDGTMRGCSALGIAQVNTPRDVLGARCVRVRQVQADRITESSPGTVLWWSRYEVAPRLVDGTLVNPGDAGFWPAQERSLDEAVDRLASGGATVVIVLTERPGIGMRTRCTPQNCNALLRLMVEHDDLRRHWNQIVVEHARRDRRIRTISVEDLLCPVGNPPTTGADVNLCNDTLPGGRLGRPDGTHVALDDFGTTVARAMVDRTIAAAR